MTDEELLQMAYDALHKIMSRLENPPRPLSGQAMIDAIIAHEDERRDGFHLSTYSFIQGIRFAEKRLGVVNE